MPANSPIFTISAIFDGLLTITGRRVAARHFKGAGTGSMGQCWDYYPGTVQIRRSMEEREQSNAPSGGDPYREVAGKLREIARECQLPRARQEILALAERFERRAAARDRRASFGGSG
jgi:hypothetical protein